MGAKSNIEWTDASWTPIRARNIKTSKVGWHCEHATTGCEFCYAESMNKRLGTGLPFKPGHRKDVELGLNEKMLLAPLSWQKPRMIFVCSMTDLFADFVPDECVDELFAVMGLAHRHTFQVLTKRPERMRAYCERIYKPVFNYGGPDTSLLYEKMDALVEKTGCNSLWWKRRIETRCPLPNVWLGVSVERQQEADERIPLLLRTSAAVRFISAEPLLGPIDLGHWITSWEGRGGLLDYLDWVIVGGESGHNARPFHVEWAEQRRRSGRMADAARYPGNAFELICKAAAQLRHSSWVIPMRDLVDQMGDRGRAPRDLSDEHESVEKSSLHDFTMALHYDTGKAIWVSETGEESKAVWLARSQIEFAKTGRDTDAVKKDGQCVRVALVSVVIPEWLAKQKGLI